LIIGAVAALGAVALGRTQRRTYDEDVRDIAAVRVILDTKRQALAKATMARDSAILLKESSEREYFLGRREYHMPFRAAAIARWWAPTGRGTLLFIAGVALVAVGGGMLLADRRRRS
jgi:hypothetical protein